MPEAPESSEAACAYADEVSAHVQSTMQQNATALSDLVTATLQHFNAGGSLADFARGLGLGSDADIQYIESIPSNKQDEIRTIILDRVGRVPPWSVLIAYAVGDFDVRTDDDLATRTTTLTLVGPPHYA